MAEEKIARKAKQQEKPKSPDPTAGMLYAPDRAGRLNGNGRPAPRLGFASRKPGRPKAVVFKPRKVTSVIQQWDLEEFLFLEREMRESVELWKAKRDSILELLKSGARVEVGVHLAKIEQTLKVR
jgi:hypothetical protein